MGTARTQSVVTSSERPRAQWCLASGVRSLGAVRGSGLRDAAYLVRRGDGQVLQVTELLHLVLGELRAGRPACETAEAVSDAFGRRLTVEGLEHLLRTKLAPLGLVSDLSTAADAPGNHGEAPRADPLLGLRFRVHLLPARLVRALARVMAPLFWPPVVVLAVAGVVALDVVLLRQGELMVALEQVLASPAFLLALFAILTSGALVHELGHAAACHYGGGTPGTIGAGVYLVFPAFYTDVTDSYRLDRPARVRTDLGGLYFNVWSLLLLGTGYLLTQQPLLLLTILLMHIEMGQQLLPTVRFDGYFVLSDIAGVPDLFARVRPVIVSLLPGRPVDPRVAELRPRARRAVTAWVLLVVPLLVLGLGWLLLHLPQIVVQTLNALAAQASVFVDSLSSGAVAALVLSVISVVVLLIPLLGIAVLLQRLSLILWSAGRRALPSRRSGGSRTTSAWSRHRGGPTHARTRRYSPMARDTRAEELESIDDLWLPRRDDVQQGVAAPGDEPGLPATSPPESVPAEPDQAQAGPDRVPADPDRAPADPDRAPAAADGESRVSSSGEPLPDLTAAAFTDERILTRRRAVPQRGWQKTLYESTSGRLNPGPGRAESREQDLLDRVRAPIHGSRRVVVMSRKGGVGKTTVTLALGSTFAMVRGDRVVAVDANPDAGNLAHRVAEPADLTITDVLADIEDINSYADLRRYTTQNLFSRLEVLASDDDARIGQALDRDAYHRVISLLDRYYNLIMLDTGTGILDSANQGLLTEADQLVLVLRPAVDGARAAALTLDWLLEHHYGDLVRQAVVVINGVRAGLGVPLEEVEDHFTRRCAHVLQVPWDKALETGGRTEMARLRPATRQALTELAAAVADNFRKGAGRR